MEKDLEYRAAISESIISRSADTQLDERIPGESVFCRVKDNSPNMRVYVSVTAQMERSYYRQIDRTINRVSIADTVSKTYPD